MRRVVCTSFSALRPLGRVKDPVLLAGRNGATHASLFCMVELCFLLRCISTFALRLMLLASLVRTLPGLLGRLFLFGTDLVGLMAS